MQLAMMAAIAGSLDLGGMASSAPTLNRREEESEALKSANAKINKVRQDRRLWLLKEREIRQLNCRERRELERNIYAEY